MRVLIKTEARWWIYFIPDSPWNAIVASEIMGRVMDPDPLVQNSAIDTVNKLARCGEYFCRSVIMYYHRLIILSDQTLLMSLVAPTGLGAIMTSFDDANPYIRVSAIRFFIKLIEISECSGCITLILY